MNLLQKFNQEQMEQLSQGKVMPSFKAGDTIRVNLRIIAGATERLQAFEGVVIRKRNKGLDSSCVVRKLSHGVGVEKDIKLYSPIVHSISVVKRGVVRRAKIYYIRKLKGKAARIKERISTDSAKA